MMLLDTASSVPGAIQTPTSDLSRQSWFCEQHFRIQSWFARVPSISNPADAPSRGENASFLAHAAEAEIKVGWLRCLARGAVPQVFLQSTH